MSYTELMKAIENFRRVYGDRPDFAAVVGQLLDAADTVRSSTRPSLASMFDKPKLQHEQITFNSAGQEPAKPEPPSTAQPGREATAGSSTAPGARPGPATAQPHSYSAGRA